MLSEAEIRLIGNGTTNAGELTVRGAGITNNGLITVNAASFNGASDLSFNDGNNSLGSAFLLDGNGKVMLNAVDATNDARIVTGAGGDSFTNGPNHTIGGAGLFVASMVNQGLVENAVSSTGFSTLQFSTGSYANEGTFRAGDGTTFLVSSANNNLGNYAAAADTLSGGRYEVIDAGNGATMTLQNAPIAVIASDAEVILSGENASLPQLSSLASVAGKLGVYDGQKLSTGGLAIPGAIEFALNALTTDTTLTINGNVDFTGGVLDILDAGIGPGTYEVISWTGSRTGQLTLGSTPANGLGYSLATVDTGSGVVRLTVVPEPSGLPLLLAALASGLTGIRRRP